MSPVLGFGLDYQYRDGYPGGIAGLCEQFRGRLSHLSGVFIENSAHATAFRAVAGDLPIVHHLSNVAPANPGGPNLERLRSQDLITRQLGAVWCGEDIGIWSLGPYSLPYFAPPLFEEDVAAEVADGILAVLDESAVPFLAEIPSCSFVAGSLSLGEFFHRLVERSGCRLVLDASHVFSYALATGRRTSDVLASLPLDAVWEIHVAGGRVDPEYPHRYIDSHSEPIPEEVLAVLSEAVRTCAAARGVTYEIGVGLTSPQIAAEVERLERLLRADGFRPKMQASGSDGV